MLRAIRDVYRLDYTSLFCLLPLDVHHLMLAYIGRGVRKEFDYVETRDVPPDQEIRLTHRGEMLPRLKTGMCGRMCKPNGNVIAVKFERYTNGYHGNCLCECVKGRRWRCVSVSHLNASAFCVTPTNGCVVYSQQQGLLVQCDENWKKKNQAKMPYLLNSLGCQSSGNIICLERFNAKFMHLQQLSSVDVHKLHFVIMYEWKYARIAVDMYDQILLTKPNLEISLFSPELVELRTYNIHTICLYNSDMHVDKHGNVYLCSCNKLTILA